MPTIVLRFLIFITVSAHHCVEVFIALSAYHCVEVFIAVSAYNFVEAFIALSAHHCVDVFSKCSAHHCIMIFYGGRMGESHEKRQGRPRQLGSLTNLKNGVGNFKRNTNLRLNLMGHSLKGVCHEIIDLQFFS